ncbi:MAG: TetR family transcriptional regulator [Solirubrobacterales bacterium]|nr:TetR family transcriptional regulator [Solirubrobacterales bacterium]
MYTARRTTEELSTRDREPSTRRGRARPHERRRSNARRLLLLQTTLRLIADEGIDAVSHRSVAEAAGVPLGSTTYWFSSRQEMLRQALEYFARLEIETLHEHLAGVLGRRLSRRRLVDEFTAILLPQLGEQRWRTVAQYALFQEAARQPELEPVCREWTRAWEQALTEVFASLRAPAPELEARMFLAMLDGMLLSQLPAPDPDPEHTVIRPVLKAWFARIPTR